MKLEIKANTLFFSNIYISKFVPPVEDEAYGQLGNVAKGKDVPISAVGATTTPFVVLSKHFVWREDMLKIAIVDEVRFSFRYPERSSSHGMTRKMQNF
jgi:hypothetical protein